MSYKKAIFLSLTAISAFTACNKDKENTASNPTTNQEVTLRVSWWGGDDRHKKTLEALRLFEEKHPNIKIKSEYGGWQGWQEKITTQMAGNMAPDLMQINWNWINIFSKNGDGFYNLNDLNSTIDLNQYDKNILEQCVVNGKLNAIPYGVAGRVFLYNKTTYDKASLTLPKSFDDIISSTKVMKEKLGNDYFGFEADYYGALLLMLYKLEQETGKPFIV
ncbi:ABC transporter substrate-binding protein, partial [Cetobacterium sp.]